MSRFFILFVLYSLVNPAMAQVIVKSGAHDGFTRLVIDFDHPVEWRVGRSEDGYELRTGEKYLPYDLSKVFNLIRKDRLKSISVDEKTGSLRFNLGCQCHVIAFEFRPGIIVIDLRDGIPEEGSSTENILPEHPDSQKFNLENTQNAIQFLNNRNLNFEWAAMAIEASNINLKTNEETSKAPTLDFTLRENLIKEVGRGASLGIIDIEVQRHQIGQNRYFDYNRPSTPLDKENRSFEIMSEEDAVPGVVLRSVPTEPQNYGTSKNRCFESSPLEMSNWSGEEAVWTQMGSPNLEIVGEFDLPNVDAITRYSKFLISIGFGAEARSILTSFEDSMDDTELIIALSFIVDGQDDPTDYFSGQESCNSAASLWATLDSEATVKREPVNISALLHSYSSLSIDMRKNIGPRLVKILLSRDEFSAAKQVHNFLVRSPDGRGPTVSLIEASMDLYDNKAASAEAKANAEVLDPGPETWSAIVAMVEAREEQGLPINTETLLALEAVSREREATDEHPRVLRALVLAYAQAGDFAGAFHALSLVPSASAKLWRLLSLLGTDDDLLEFAVFQNEVDISDVDRSSINRIVARLTDLGMTKSAAYWAEQDRQIDRIPLAKAELLQGNALTALSLVADGTTEDAIATRALALRSLGMNGAAALLYSDLGDVEREISAIQQERDWDEVAARGSTHWRSAAELLGAPENSTTALDAGPLEKVFDMVVLSEKSRQVISLLLESPAVTDVTGPARPAGG